MAAARHVSDDERRARLAHRHLLAVRGQSVEAAADAVVVLHATDPASVYLSALARTGVVTVADIDRALFEERSLLRLLAMRRTLFVATQSAVPMVERSSSPAVAANERRKLEGYLSQSGVVDPAAWLQDAAAEVLEALGSGGMVARQLTAEVPRLATRIMVGAGTKHGVEMGATSRVIGLMAVEGVLARGRPSNGWTGRQYTWHARSQWSPAAASNLEPDEAAAQLLAAWLRRFGPGTVDDLKWWTGWTKTRTRNVLAMLDTATVTLDGGHDGLLLADDVAEVEAAPHWVALLPALDPTPMGWKQRDWYLGKHRGELFDRNGNIGPTIWADGAIVGGWAQRADGVVVTHLLDDVPKRVQTALKHEVSRVQEFVGDKAVKPSFPTPLQKRLAVSDPS